MSGASRQRGILDKLHFPSWPFVALVRRELVRSLRQGRPYVLLLVLVVFCGILVFGNYPRSDAVPGIVASFSEDIVISLVITLFGAALVLMPAYGATTIQTERARDTYDLLSLTLIRPSGVVFAKWLNTLGIFGFLVVATFPFFGTAFFLIGMNWEAVVASGVVILAAAVSCASVGVMCSAWLRGSITSVICSYLGAAFVMGGFLLPLGLLAWPFVESIPPGYNRVAEGIALVVGCVSPLVALVVVTEQTITSWAVLATVIGQALFAAFALRRACVLLRRPCEPAPPPLEDIPPIPGRPAKSPAPGSSVRPIPDRCNPVCVREQRWGTFQRGAWATAIWGGLLGTLLFVALAAASLFDQERLYRLEDVRIMLLIWVSVLMAAVILVAPGLAAVSVVSEMDRQSLDLLRMSGMSGPAILWGKTASALRQSGRVLLAGAAATLFLFKPISLEPASVISLFTGFGALAITMALCVVIGIWASVRARTTAMAVLLAYGLSGLVLFSPVLLQVFIPPFFYTMGWGRPATDEFFALSPVSLHIWAHEFIDNPGVDAFLSVWSAYSMAQVTAVGVLYYVAQRRFLRTRMVDE